MKSGDLHPNSMIHIRFITNEYFYVFLKIKHTDVLQNGKTNETQSNKMFIYQRAKSHNITNQLKY